MTSPPDVTQHDRQHDRAPEAALDWHRAGQGAVLATVIETWSSAPRPVGSQLAISGQGAFIGSVSGGCVEGAVVIEAAEALAEGRPRIVTYGVADEDAFAAGLACGGRIRILIEPLGTTGPALSPDLLAALTVPRQTALALVTDLQDWTRQLVTPRTEAGTEADIDARLQSDTSGLTEDGRFVLVRNTPLRLIVIGAVPVAAPLVSMAESCGYSVHLIDPRTSFAAADRFPNRQVLDSWPDEALRQLGPDARTAIVTLTHDPKLDDPTLTVALQSPAFFIGCLGSRRTHAKRLDRLAALGFDPLTLDRLQGPVGLDIGAVTPAEIAVSILAAITQALRGSGMPK